MSDNKSNGVRSTLADGCDYFYFCDLCVQGGENIEAFVYCMDCQDYLCKECFHTHLRPKSTRSHVLLDQHQMPKDQQHMPKDQQPMPKDQEAHISSSETYGHNATNESTACVPSIKAIISSAVLLLAILLAGVFYQHAAPVNKNRDAWETRSENVLDIKVRSTDDSKTGSVVLPCDKLVVVDWNNGNLKLIDMAHNTLLYQVVLVGILDITTGARNTPVDITKVTGTQVAVTSPSIQKIYFVNVSNKLKLESEVKVKGQCRGMASIDDKLVSYSEPVKVEIISLTGHVLLTVVTSDKGNVLFDWPYNVAVNRDQHTIYISDRDTVTSVDLTGHVQATYKSGKLGEPLGLTVDSTGKVYVCDEYSHNILQLTADLTEIQQILQESDGVVYPYYVYYCETTDRLYVGMYKSDVIKVYQLK